MEKQNNVIEYRFEASAFQWAIAPGKTVAAWGFNRQVPGPTLKARKGDTLVVKLKTVFPNPLSLAKRVVHYFHIRVTDPKK